MSKTKIRLAYRLVIDSTAVLTWDKYVWEDTFKEYLMQHQQFNTKENPKSTFRELLSENEKAAQLHYLVGIAANAYVAQLKGNLYRVADKLGDSFFPFTNYQLDIINTDSRDSSKHKIGITFYSPLLTYFGIVENHYLVSQSVDEVEGYETHMFAVLPNLAICYYQE